jgi:hypothetical protein
VSYTIDLTDSNAKKLRDALAKFIDVSAVERTGPLPSAPRAARTSGRRDPAETRKIKEWGAANGFKVPARGRLSNDLLAAYEAAH